MGEALEGTELQDDLLMFSTPSERGEFNAAIYHGWLNAGVALAWTEWAKIFSQQSGIEEFLRRDGPLARHLQALYPQHTLNCCDIDA